MKKFCSLLIFIALLQIVLFAQTTKKFPPPKIQKSTLVTPPPRYIAPLPPRTPIVAEYDNPLGYCFAFTPKMDTSKLDSVIQFPRLVSKTFNFKTESYSSQGDATIYITEEKGGGKPITQRYINEHAKDGFKIVFIEDVQMIDGKYSFKNNLLYFTSDDKKTKLVFSVTKNSANTITKIKPLNEKKYWKTCTEEQQVKSYPMISDFAPTDVKVINSEPTKPIPQEPIIIADPNYAIDSTEISNAQKMYSPSKNVLQNMRYLPINASGLMDYLPYQFMNFDGVNKITIQPDYDEKRNNKIVISFNKDESFSKIISYVDNKLDDSVIFVYENAVLKKMIENNRYISNYYYNQDTVYDIAVNSVNKYVLKDKVFCLLAEYRIQDNLNIKNRDLEKLTYEISQYKNGLCTESKKEKYCFSNLQWKPDLEFIEESKYNIGNNTYQINFSTIYEKDAEGNLVVNEKRYASETNEEYTKKTVYKFSGNKITSAAINIRTNATYNLIFTYE